MEEIWKDIGGWEGLYQISSFARVKSLSRLVNAGNGERLIPEVIRKQFLRSGYYNTILFKPNEFENKHVHRLVALAFIPNTENRPFVNHKDGNKLNNNIYNLEWVTAKENTRHSYRNKLQRIIKGEERYNSKLTDTEVEEILQIHSMYGIKPKKTAKEFNVSQPAISAIISRKAWKHIQI